MNNNPKHWQYHGFTATETGEWLTNACHDKPVDYARLQRLYELGASLEEAGKTDDLTPLAYAISQNDLTLATWLIGHGADVNAIMTAQRRPLMLAAAADKADMVTLLLGHNANPNAQTARGLTALIAAAEKGAVASVRLLLDAGASTAAVDENNRTAEKAAQAAGYPDVAALIALHTARAKQKLISAAEAPAPEKIILRRKPKI
jgi:ankyrin repeat protein